MGDNTKVNQQADLPVDSSIDDAESTVQYTHLIQERAFLGIYPFEVILEGIEKQFQDYINMEDTTNYVDIFFSQLQASFNAVNNNDAEEHPNEIKEVLEINYRKFIDKIKILFNDRLSISIIDIENDNIDDPDLEFIIRRLYEFFILGARNNFKTIIATDLLPIVKDIGDDDAAYFRAIDESMDRYNPLITSVTPTEFLKYRGDQEVYDLFENHRVNGNFLKKYSPKLYMNEDFQVEVINYVTMVHQFKQDVIINNKEESGLNG